MKVKAVPSSNHIGRRKERRSSRLPESRRSEDVVFRLAMSVAAMEALAAGCHHRWPPPAGYHHHCHICSVKLDIYGIYAFSILSREESLQKSGSCPVLHLNLSHLPFLVNTTTTTNSIIIQTIITKVENKIIKYLNVSTVTLRVTPLINILNLLDIQNISNLKVNFPILITYPSLIILLIIPNFKNLCGNNSTLETSSSTFGQSNNTDIYFLTSEQYTKFIILISDNQGTKETPTNANMEDIALNSFVTGPKWVVDSGASQHMIASYSLLHDTVDVSNINFRVGHPNGTSAKIKK
ncbi:hypothetical protein LXL04_023229 [Taraxacum kok-saghyz]